jgi:phosphomethylpyrimidine synthase
VGGDLDYVRRRVLESTDLPVGNVPLYQAFCEANRRYGHPDNLDEELLFDLIERQCADGISFMAIHCGINLYTIERLHKQGYRFGGLVSKGGTSMVSWMLQRRGEPLYEHFDRLSTSCGGTTWSSAWATASAQARFTTRPTARRSPNSPSTANWPRSAARWVAR